MPILRQGLTTWAVIFIFCLIVLWLRLANKQLTSSVFPISIPFPNSFELCGNLNTVKTQSYYKSYIEQGEAFRKRFDKKLETFHENAINPWKNPWNIYFWDAFIPTLSCPHFLERIGAPAGGGKWLCGFEIFEYSKMQSEDQQTEPCVLFSFGVGPDSSFEAEFLTRTNCFVYMFDHTSGAPVDGPASRLPPGMEKRWTYETVGLGNHSSSAVRTLGDTMRKYGHKWIDFLKVDVEWNEYTTFNQIMEEFDVLPFGQLNLEIHLQNTDYNNEKDRLEYNSFYLWWKGLLDHGLRAFTWEVNHHPSVTGSKKPFAVEYSFLNIKRNPKILKLE